MKRDLVLLTTCLLNEMCVFTGTPSIVYSYKRRFCVRVHSQIHTYRYVDNNIKKQFVTTALPTIMSMFPCSPAILDTIHFCIQLQGFREQ